MVIEYASEVLVVSRGLNVCMLVSVSEGCVSTGFTADSLFAMLPLY